MHITLRYIARCPNRAVVEDRLRTALPDTPYELELALVADDAEAARLGFIGSPTVLVDGIELFSDPHAEPTYACRLYLTEDGPQGAPSVAQLRAAIVAAKGMAE